jgi:hypothetical protein
LSGADHRYPDAVRSRPSKEQHVGSIRKLGELGWVTGPTAEQWDHAQLIEFGKAIRGTHFGRGGDRIAGFHLPLLQSTEHRSRRTPFREQPP